jgi:hypothetical protein
MRESLGQPGSKTHPISDLAITVDAGRHALACIAPAL